MPAAALPLLSSSTRPLTLPVGSSTISTCLDSPGLSRSLTTPLVVKPGAADAVTVNDLADTSGNEKCPLAVGEAVTFDESEYPAATLLPPETGRR